MGEVDALAHFVDSAPRELHGADTDLVKHRPLVRKEVVRERRLAYQHLCQKHVQHTCTCTKAPTTHPHAQIPTQTAQFAIFKCVELRDAEDKSLKYPSAYLFSWQAGTGDCCQSVRCQIPENGIFGLLMLFFLVGKKRNCKL